MPPRTQLNILAAPFSKSTAIPTFLLPFLHVEARRSASILGDLRDNPGAYSKRIRRGRGPSSGKGKTSGRGHKGQKQHGKVPAGFQGGQTPDHIVHGKYGFINPHSKTYTKVNLDTIQQRINESRLDPTRPITIQTLNRTGLINGDVGDGVKLLARQRAPLTTPIHIVVSAASAEAINLVEAAGGTVTTRYYTPDSIRRLKKGECHPYVSLRWDPRAMNNPALRTAGADTPEERVTGLGYPYRLPDPSSRKDLEYYRDVRHRGYLSHLVDAARGEVADLYFTRRMEGLNLGRADGQAGSVGDADGDAVGVGVGAGVGAREKSSPATTKRERGEARKEDNRLW